MICRSRTVRDVVRSRCSGHCNHESEQLDAAVHPSGMLRNLLIVPRAFDFLSKHKKLMGAKGLWKIVKASWCLKHMGLGFLTAYGRIATTVYATMGVIRMTACCASSSSYGLACSFRGVIMMLGGCMTDCCTWD